VDELIDLMDKEEILEVEEQVQKSLEKDSKTSQTEESIKATHKSTVPATPVTTEPGFGKEELVDDAVRESSKGAYGDPCTEENKQKSIAVLKSNSKSDEIKNPPITSGVPPTAKKAEGSKQL